MAAPTKKNDSIIGTGDDDNLEGLRGRDTITGLSGNDTLDGGVGDDSLDGGTDNDSLIGGKGKDILLGGSGHDFLNGGKDNDALDGGAGNDTLDGGTGMDTMVGGDGDDFYLVDNTRDQVIEKTGILSGRMDVVQSKVNYTLSDNIEKLVLTGLRNLKGAGNDGNNRIEGNRGDNLLEGMNGFDTLVGGDGDDTLSGGSGVDQLIGGDGSDYYLVSSLEDDITETKRDGDQDVVESTVSYSLDDNVEVLVLAGTSAIDGTGNELDNIIYGNGAANTLYGEEGFDYIVGDDGDDTIDGGEGDDTIDGGQGYDTVYYQGNQDEYKVYFDADSQTLVVEDVNGTDGDGTDEGVDQITNVEIVAFADSDYDVATVVGIPSDYGEG
jgi:Ca2+-binding RTX toxin-like protein